MFEITKIIIAVVVGLFGGSILFSIFKFIIVNYFKQIKKNENDIKNLDKRVVKLETLEEIDEKKSRE